MTVGERLALQQDRIEEEQRQQMTALQRRQRRRLEYMQVASGVYLCQGQTLLAVRLCCEVEAEILVQSH